MISFQHVSYTYPEASRPILEDVSLEIPGGALALVTGPSGAGKSTLLRCINGLVPHFSGGVLRGSIRVNGLDPVQASPQVISQCVGFVFQDPEAQFVLDCVEDEIAFALENMGMPPAEMHARVDEVLEILNLAHLRERALWTLSGGEQQRTAIAAALALRPEILVLDEPTSQLDPQSAEDVLRTLEGLKQRLGLTIVLAEHRLERVLPFTDLLIHVERRQVIVGEPHAVLPQISLNPPIAALGKALGWNPLPLTVDEARPFAANLENNASVQSAAQAADPPARTPRLQAINVCFDYGTAHAVLSASLELYAGEIVALMGANGAGKSTLVRCLVGLLRPSQGKVLLDGKDTARMDVADICLGVGYLPQDPNALLFAETVLEELRITLRNHRLPVQEEQLNPFLNSLGLDGLASRYPRDLSVGERQRAALATVTITQPQVILLDEPTRGLDYVSKANLLEILNAWRQAGKAILLITHDVEFAVAASDRLALMERGQIMRAGRPAEVIRGLPMFTPQIAQLFPETGWLTVQDGLDGLSQSGSSDR
jgi:energy-coupling factor transport system ATP-binding protein